MFDPQADGSDTLVQQCCNNSVVFFSSIHTLDAYAHCQKTCPFASLEVQSLLCTSPPTRRLSPSCHMPSWVQRGQSPTVPVEGFTEAPTAIVGAINAITQSRAPWRAYAPKNCTAAGSITGAGRGCTADARRPLRAAPQCAIHMDSAASSVYGQCSVPRVL